jgi:16S rRNA processing protein RimM
LPDGEYYQFQLIGLAVETKDGERLGTLRSIFETGGNDVYVVDCGGKELLVPAIEDVVCEIDLENNRMIVDLPEGLE